jgi:hypothetical protein
MLAAGVRGDSCHADDYCPGEEKQPYDEHDAPPICDDPSMKTRTPRGTRERDFHS